MHIDHLDWQTTSDTSVNLEEHWFNAIELISSSIHLLNGPVEVDDERNQVLDSLKSTLNLISNSVKTMTSVTPMFVELIDSLMDLLNYSTIDEKVNVCQLNRIMWRDVEEYV